jgi:hypothetical protein
LEESLDVLLDEIQRRLSALESSLPKHLDAKAISPTAKLPFKALVYREALIWRMAELSRVAFHSYEADKIAAATLITRAAIETSAALWYLCAKLEATVRSGTVADIDSYLMKLAMGSKINPDMPQPINVMTFVDRVDKDIPGFQTPVRCAERSRASQFSRDHTSLFQVGRAQLLCGFWSKYSRLSQHEEIRGDRSQRRVDNVRKKLQPHRRPHPRFCCAL